MGTVICAPRFFAGGDLEDWKRGHKYGRSFRSTRCGLRWQCGPVSCVRLRDPPSSPGRKRCFHLVVLVNASVARCAWSRVYLAAETTSGVPFRFRRRRGAPLVAGYTAAARGSPGSVLVDPVLRRHCAAARPAGWNPRASRMRAFFGGRVCGALLRVARPRIENLTQATVLAVIRGHKLAGWCAYWALHCSVNALGLLVAGARWSQHLRPAQRCAKCHDPDSWYPTSRAPRRTVSTLIYVSIAQPARVVAKVGQVQCVQTRQ